MTAYKCETIHVKPSVHEYQQESKTQLVGRRLRASKYVLVILLVYTLSWLPFIVTFLGDFLLLKLGVHDSWIQQLCDSFTDSMDQANCTDEAKVGTSVMPQ